MLQIKHGRCREIVTGIFTQATEKTNFRKNRDFRIPSVNTIMMVLKARAQKSGNRSCKNKQIYFSKQFQKRNQKLGTIYDVWLYFLHSKY